MQIHVFFLDVPVYQSRRVKVLNPLRERHGYAIYAVLLRGLIVSRGYVLLKTYNLNHLNR